MAGSLRKEAFIMSDNKYDWNGFVPENNDLNKESVPTEETKSEHQSDLNEEDFKSVYSDEVSSLNSNNASNESDSIGQTEPNKTVYNYTAPKEKFSASQPNTNAYDNNTDSVEPKANGSIYGSSASQPGYQTGRVSPVPNDNSGSGEYTTHSAPNDQPGVNQSQAGVHQNQTGFNYTGPKDDPMAYHPVYHNNNVPNYASQPESNTSYQYYAYDYNATAETQQGEPPKSKKKKDKSGKLGLKVAAIALVCALLGSGAGGVATYYALSSNDNSNSALNSSSTGQTVNIDESYNSAVEAVADKVIPSVVGIQAAYTSVEYGLFGQNSEAISEGTGVVYSEEGYIITNYHVVSSAINSGTITVVLDENDSEGYPATVVGYDASSDLAVLKIDASGLTPIEFGNSEEVKVGQTAIAVGNPGGLQFMNSVSLGIISGLNRSLTTESGETMNLIQTDAAINPGNSGGALVDGTGKLIGINSAKISGSSDSSSANYEGMGFAIPVNTVIEISDKLIANEGKKSAYLGVQIDSRYDASTLEEHDYPGGLVVYSVVDGSPASAAGIQPNDILVSLDGTALTTFDILSSLLSQYSAGDTVTIEVFRSNQTYSLTVTLGENIG